ncbi:DUF1707 SHOCT-like domain-containing protein [Gordonia phthalatica]|uniref:DUF1707 domain-containing protein n=1 Tax=Gordonia phthalatica TaxID=1136941 RepID=A0A0N9N181_9ACTN|nr:DUF1707 domain-containing protein [Gordonia phthalatica]ALG83868.1 hypothetical protein ACH46_04260 [Gordonia phthalatica]
MSDLEPRDVRASDADRERTHSLLSAAMSQGALTPEEYSERAGQAVNAKTRGELDLLVNDLPLDQLRSAAVDLPHNPTRISASGARPVTTATAIFGGREIGGRAVVGTSLAATAFMGGVELDLRNVEFTAPVLEIHCRAVMGGIEITVPHDVTVEIHGIGIMGGFGGRGAGPGNDGAPRVVIGGFAFMGGVGVRRREG